MNLKTNFTYHEISAVRFAIDLILETDLKEWMSLSQDDKLWYSTAMAMSSKFSIPSKMLRKAKYTKVFKYYEAFTLRSLCYEFSRHKSEYQVEYSTIHAKIDQRI